jgi:hypothetical protein
MLPRHGDTVNAVHLNPVADALQILSAGDDGTVRVSDCETCRPGDQARIRERTLIPADDRRLDPTTSVGQCFTELPGPDVDCAEPHHYEVYAVVTHPAKDGEPYPSEMMPSRWAWSWCQGEAYTDYRGNDFAEDPSYRAQAYGPRDSVEWELGQRTFVCLLSPENTGETTTGSARESGGQLFDRRSHLRFLGLPVVTRTSSPSAPQ